MNCNKNSITVLHVFGQFKFPKITSALRQSKSTCTAIVTPFPNHHPSRYKFNYRPIAINSCYEAQQSRRASSLKNLPVEKMSSPSIIERFAAIDRFAVGSHRRQPAKLKPVARLERYQGVEIAEIRGNAGMKRARGARGARGRGGSRAEIRPWRRINNRIMKSVFHAL